MLAIDIGNNRENGREVQERTVALVGFGDQVLRVAKARIRAHCIHAATYHHCRVQPTRRQHCGDHGSGGRFTMHTCNRNPIFQAHQFRQHFCTPDHRDVLSPGLQHLGVRRADRGTHHHDFSNGGILFLVTFVNHRSQTREPLRYRTRLHIGAGNLIAKVQQHLGNAAHADAANAYEMNALNLGKHELVVSR